MCGAKKSLTAVTLRPPRCGGHISRLESTLLRSHLCRYCEAFVERDNLYIVMEMAEHGDGACGACMLPHPDKLSSHTRCSTCTVHRQLSRFKAANKYVKEATIWSYLCQLCLALQELHSRKILHRVRRCGAAC